MEIIGGIQVSGSIDIYEGVLRTIEASGSFSGSGFDLYDIQAENIKGLTTLGTGSVTASVHQDNGFVVNSIASGSTFSGSLTVSGTLRATKIEGVDTSLISSGSATASIKIDGNNTGSLHINTEVDITGSLYVTGTTIIQGRLAQGESTLAGGLFAHAEGRWTSASQAYSHAEGIRSTAAGLYSHAEGEDTRAGGYASHTQGQGTSASGSHQLVMGAFNLPLTRSHAFIIGNGGNAATRSNLLFASGNLVEISGSLIVSGTISATKFEGVDTTLISTGSATASMKLDANGTSSMQINTNVFVTGSLTAKNIFADSASITYLTTVYQTSSYEHITGSTKFGDELADVHEFTGSVGITGSFTMNSSSIYVNQPVSGTNIFGTSSHAESASYTSYAESVGVADGGIY